MSATHLYKPTPIRKPWKPRNPVPEGWITMKQFRAMVSDKYHVRDSMAHEKIYHGDCPKHEIQRINKRVIFVKLTTD